jgi:hypothetical protein
MNETAVSGRRWPRRLLITLGVLVALVIVIRLLLDPLAAHYTRKELNAAPSVSGDFSRVHVTVLPPGYAIVLESLEEHLSVERIVADVMDSAPGDERLHAKINVLKEQVLHHVNEEEHDLFPRLKKEMPAEEREALGEQLAARTHELNEDIEKWRCPLTIAPGWPVAEPRW